MAMVIEAVYEQGVFRPRQNVTLREGQIVEIRVPDEAPGGNEKALAELMSLAGAIHGNDPHAASEERVAAALAKEHARS